MNDIRSLFPVALDRVYMDHASEGPMPAPARKAVEKLLRLYVREGKPSISDYTEVIEEARKLAAGLLNASPSEIAFVKNTSHGIILAIASIPWRPGDNVVLLKDAFPANVYPWLNLLPDVEKRWVQLEDGVTGNDRTDVLRQFSNCVDEHTRAISLDWVHYLTGRRLELRELGAFCK